MDSTIIESVEDKFNKKIEILHKRNEERLQDIEKEKEDKKLLNAENEKLDYFKNVYMERRNKIEIAIKHSFDKPKPELPNHFNAISKDILTLQKYVANSNLFLRGYDIKIFQKSLLELTTKAKECEDKLLPKKKFGFKNKMKPKVSTVDNIDGHAPSEVEHINISFIHNNKNACTLTNRENENLYIEADEMFRKDVTLNNIKNCKVKLFGAPSTLHMNSLQDSIVFCGPVSTSIFIENCKNCTFIIACQQLRLHKSENVNIYLHVTSRAIMEDCSNIYFTSYNLQYDQIDEDFKKSGLDISINNWNCIDDFNWLNADKASPNWRVLNAENIVKNWNEIINKM